MEFCVINTWFPFNLTPPRGPFDRIRELQAKLSRPLNTLEIDIWTNITIYFESFE